MSRMRQLLISGALGLLALPLAAQTLPERFTEYAYDEAGRVSAIETAVEAAAPTVSALEPAAVRHGPAMAMTAMGTSLRGATVSASHPGLTVSAVTATEGRVTFRLQVADLVPLGDYTLRFTTQLGSAEIAVAVWPRLPVLSVSPNPLALAPGESRAVALRTDVGDVVGHALTVAATPGAVATVTPNSAQVPVGGTEAGTVTVTGVAGGHAVLWVEVDELADVLVPVFVTERYRPPPGGAAFHSSLLGVLVGSPVPPPVLVSRGPFAALLGVVMPGAAVPPPPVIGPLVAPALGVSLGPVARAIVPGRVVRGEGAQAVEVLGSGLQGLALVELAPASGVSLVLDSVEADGTRARFEVTADAQAALGARALRLADGEGREIPFAQSGAGVLRIVEPLPEIEWVSPLLLVRGGGSTTLTVRGARLTGATAVRLTPGDGIAVGGSPVVSADGRQLTVNLSVAPEAPLGARVVTVATDAGESSAVAVPANTVQVVGGLGPAVTPVVSPALGVRVGGDAASVRDLSLASAPVQVSRGAVFSALAPGAAAAGETLTLAIDGVGLQAVDTVSFEPADGIAAGMPSVSADGRRVQAEISVAADAVRGPRRLRLFAAGVEVPPSMASAASFRVTSPQPEIETLSPLLWVPGAAPATLNVTGRHLADVVAVRLLPADGVSVSSLGVAADGRSLTATLSVAAGAALGPRVVVLDSPTGHSTESAQASNTVQFVSGLGAPVSALSSPLLGVAVGGGPTGSYSLDLVSSLLGVRLGGDAPTPAEPLLLSSNATGVVVGPVATGASPRYLPAGRDALLRVEGIGLAAVAALDLLPGDGIALAGPLAIAADGRSLTVPVTVDAGAAQTARRVFLRNGAADEVPFATPASAVVRVVGSEPRIDSISPIQVIPGQSFVLTIRGVNLFGVSAVTATPSTGLNISVNPAGNADGTEVTVAITVAPDAPGGPRVIRVVTSNGTTSDEAVPANTLTVVTNP